MSENANNLQEMVYLYRFLQNQHNLMNEQLEFLQEQQYGLNISKNSIEGLKEAKIDQELIVPLGTGAFAYAKILNPAKIMIKVNKDIVIEKEINDGLIFIERNIEHIISLREKVVQQIQEIEKKLEELEPTIKSIYDQNNH